MKPPFDSTRPLTDSQREEFRTRDERFIKNWSRVWEAVSDLVFIQKNRLYREDFPSFEAYLKSRCNLGKAYAYQLIEAHRVIEKVKLLELKIPRASEISNERQPILQVLFEAKSGKEKRSRAIGRLPTCWSERRSILPRRPLQHLRPRYRFKKPTSFSVQRLPRSNRYA